MLDKILKLDWDLAIPGNDDPQPRSYVKAYRDNIAKFVDRAKAAVKMGVPEDQLMASIKTDDLPFKIDLQPAALDGFYAEAVEIEITTACPPARTRRSRCTP